MSVGLGKALPPAVRAAAREELDPEGTARRAAAEPETAGTAAPHGAGDERAGGLSRRQLLRTGGALGASLLAAQMTRGTTAARAAGNRPNVVVVGAGLAGVTAAYRLAQVGIPVNLYEASDRVGGRCFTARGFSGGQTAEHGGEFVDTRHVHLIKLAQELGLTLEDFFDAQGNPPGWPAYIGGTWYPEDAWDPDFDRLTRAIIKQARAIGAVSNGAIDPTAYSYGTATPAARQLDQLSMTDWLDQRLPGTTGSPFGKLLERIAGSGIGLPMSGSSAINWMDLLGPDDADERYHIRGGNDQVPTLAAAALPRGALHMNAPLQRLSRRNDGRYELRFGGIGATVLADRVVLALPYSTLRDVDLSCAGLSPHRMSVIQQLSMGTNGKLLLRYDDRPQAHTYALGQWTGFSLDYGAARHTWDSTRRQPGNGSITTMFYGGQGAPAWAGRPAHAGASGAFVANAVSHLDATVPGTGAHFTGEAWIDAWVNDPWVRGSYSAYGIGQYTANEGFNYRAEGAIHFAGEHTSTYSRAYLNGGVESGQRAAIEIMNKAGVPVPANIANLPYSGS
ncbi:flavin monoamine oxidase family protein [Conexibacter woesei]|uniref:flavin monoamine oxidase family protein n=1 Tax=Conexibacter woesei TaxID=191495 RepID=UPI0009DB8A52|nr:FAD-dependent oxidoreductase [Conexibacter woesei]